MNALVVVSADTHVSEPFDLWETRLPSHLRERGPRRVPNAEGSTDVVVDVYGRSTRVLQVPEGFRDDDSATPGGGYDSTVRQRDNEDDGVWGQVLFPFLGMFGWSIPDPELQVECARVYTDWLVEQFGEFPNYVCPAMIPVADLEASVQALEQAARLGCRAAMLPMSPPVDRPYYSKSWEPVWSASEDLGIVLTFHGGTGWSVEQMSALIDASNEDGIGTHGAEVFVKNPAEALVIQLVFGGVLERHPGLQIVPVEVGASWLAPLIQTLDHEVNNLTLTDYGLPELPSVYIRRQVRTQFQDDEIAVRLRDIVGVENLLWGNDYPHNEGTWPNSRQTIERLFADVPPDDTAAIVGGNAIRLFGMSIDANASTSGNAS
jgi:predicted TIM-barrel fold metal-dependent hydrolase